MSNRAIRKAIQSLRERIFEHDAKIGNERMRDHPDEGLITHWEKEIEAFTARLRRLEERLAQKQRRGRSR
jgi:hypothetical protein